MTRNRFMLVVLIVSLLFSIYTIFGRHQVEKDNKHVELIMDYSALKDLGEDEEDLISTLKKKGLTAVAVYSLTIEDLLDRNDITFFTGGDILKIERLTGEVSENLKSFSYTADSAFIIIDNKSLIEVFNQRKDEWIEEHNLEYEEINNTLTVFIPEWREEYLELNIGFDHELIKSLQDKDLKVVPRPANNDFNNDYILSELESIAPEYVVFQGEEITGYPDNLEDTARVLLKNDILFGMIEPFIANQEGAKELSYLLDFNLLRVHSIQQKEMDHRENYGMEDITDRYLRAVRERNARLLYLKPFLEKKNGIPPEELTVSFVERLTSDLKASGFKIEDARKFRGFGNSYFSLLVISLGILAAGILLLEKILDIKLGDSAWIIMGAAVLMEIVLIFMGRIFLLRKLMAFSCSTIFPSLAVITQLKTENIGDSILFRFLKASIISTAGAFLMAASLAHTAFIVKVDQFTGVKLSFIIPLMIISIYYFQSINNDEEKSWSDRMGYFLNSSIKIKHLLIIFVLAGIGGIYILRSGNTPLIPIPDLELMLRSVLEKILLVRPRFKAFLIGHPFLIITLGLLTRKNKDHISYYPLIILGSIGQITILNTFSHIHTPVKISLIRVFHGLWLGLIFGIVLYLVIRLILQYINKKRVE